MKRPQMRKRTLFMLLLLLTGGAIIKVAVAWGATMWSPREKLENIVPPADFLHFWNDYIPTIDIGEHFEVLRVRVVAVVGLGVQEHVSTCFVTPRGTVLSNDQPRCYGFLREIKAGWPSQSFGARVLIQPKGYQVGNKIRLSGAWLISDRVRQPSGDGKINYLPLAPVWPGFAINTLFYAAILWLLFAAPGFIRRRVRRKRGLCPACAYDLRGSESKTCPECGKVVRT